MSPPKKKVGCGEDIDPISDLPSNVIDAILQRMPLHDLVKTSVLSRKWRHMWTSVSKLLFADDFFEKCKDLNCLETSSIITEVLFLHNGPIQLFSLSIPTNYAVKMECFSTWILFLSRKGVKKLRLLNLQTIPCQTPSRIFSCQELTYLELQNLKLSIVPNFPGFKNLVQLEIYDVVFESGGLESLMSGCPLLVELTICHCYGFNHINISPPICKLCINGDEVIKSICLKQAQKLIDLTLWAETDRHADNLERGWVSDFTRGLPKIMNLSLGSGYVKILSTSINPQLLRPDTLKYLRLCVNLNEAEELKFFLSLLERASNLKELVIKIYSKAVMQEMILKDFDYNNNNSCFSQLQIVNITIGIGCEHASKLVQFLLAKSPSLVTLTFKAEHLCLNESDTDAHLLFWISCDLLLMKRASPRAEVKIVDKSHVEEWWCI